MIAKVEHDGKVFEYYMNETLYKNIKEEIIPTLMRKDKDIVFVVDGREGCGKSVFSMQLGKLINSSLGICHVCFTPGEFETAVKNAKKGEVIIFDEAFRGYSSRSVLNSVNKVLWGMIQEIRQLNLCILLVVPSLFNLDRDVAVRRAAGLFHIYEHPKYPSFRMWAYYDYAKKRVLFDYGKKNYNYKVSKPLMWGKFFDYYTVDEQAYRDKKKISLMNSFNLSKVCFDDKLKSQRNLSFIIMNEDLKVSVMKISKYFKNHGIDLPPTTVYNAIKSYKLENVKDKTSSTSKV